MKAVLPKYATILNPVDGSTASELATLHAIYLTKLSGAQLVPVFVVDESAARRAGVNVRQVMEQIAKKGQEVLASVQALGERQGVIVVPLLLEGQTTPTILKTAEDQRASLVVIGRTAFTDIERLAARPISISEEVLERAPCPVLVVRGA
ncbi:MAG: universal stress protein [Chloroflexi bacterium]|nr:universal stress protein [Chloroflexota bacterium]